MNIIYADKPEEGSGLRESLSSAMCEVLATFFNVLFYYMDQSARAFKIGVVIIA